MNPLIKLWQFALWFLLAVVSIICAPASLLITGTVATVVAVARRRNQRRHDQYSWSHHRPGKPRKSGYRRARHGIFA